MAYLLTVPLPIVKHMIYRKKLLSGHIAPSGTLALTAVRLDYFPPDAPRVFPLIFSALIAERSIIR